ADNSGRVRHRDTLLPVLSKRFLELSTQEWLEKFEGASFPYAPVNTLSQTFNDPQVLHNDMVKTIEHPSAGHIKIVGPPVQFSESCNKIRSHPPRLGEHTRQVLSEVLSYEVSAIEELARRNVV
ncbi:CoA-transferase family III, partial [Trinorchestia longiramus]